MKNQQNQLPSPATANTLSSHSSFPKRLAKKAGATALAGTAVVGLLDVGSMIRTRDSNPLHGLQALYNTVNDDCPAPPSTTALNLVNQTGTNPYSQKIIMNPLQGPVMEAKQDKIELSPNRRSAVEKLMQATTPAEGTAIVSDYMEKAFGFNVELSLPKDKGHSVVLMNYLKSLRLMMQYTSLLPSQLIKAGEVSRVTITDLIDQTKTKKDPGYSGQFNPKNNISAGGEVTLDINYIDDPSVFIHEVFGHALQHTACKGTEDNDSTITLLNPKSFHYKDDPDNVNKPAVEGVTSSGYGITSGTEDYAELVSSFIVNGEAAGSAITKNTAEGQKTSVILTRFENLVPGSVNYMRQVQPTFAHFKAISNKLLPSYFANS